MDQTQTDNVILQVCTRTDGPFTISNGQQVPEYMDMYRALLHHTLRRELLDILHKRFWTDMTFTLVAGRETAGAILASLLAEDLGLPCLVVRDRVRNHGTCESVEKLHGWKAYLSDEFGSQYDSVANKVLLVDDVSSAGVGMKDSIEKLRVEGFDPVLAYCLVYRGLGAHKIAKELGVPFEYLYYHSEEPYLRSSFTS